MVPAHFIIVPPHFHLEQFKMSYLKYIPQLPKEMNCFSACCKGTLHVQEDSGQPEPDHIQTHINLCCVKIWWEKIKDLFHPRREPI
jgi:hypothetical protein